MCTHVHNWLICLISHLTTKETDSCVSNIFGYTCTRALFRYFKRPRWWPKIYFSLSEMELSKLEEILTESHQLSPKAKVGKNSTVRRKKRPLPHMRSQHLDEALSPVTTPTDDEEIQRIKQVAGSTQTRHQSPEHHHLAGGLALYGVSKLLLIISFVYGADPHTHTHTHSWANSSRETLISIHVDSFKHVFVFVFLWL